MEFHLRVESREKSVLFPSSFVRLVLCCDMFRESMCTAPHGREGENYGWATSTVLSTRSFIKRLETVALNRAVALIVDGFTFFCDMNAYWP